MLYTLSEINEINNSKTGVYKQVYIDTNGFQWIGNPNGSLRQYSGNRNPFTVEDDVEWLLIIVPEKQDELVSGENIKTINGESILGSGNIVISGGGGTWGSITGTLSAQLDLQFALDSKVDENVAIVAATKTKITYDAKGLVTAGADATTADIADSLNKRYVTDANLVVINNTSGVNTGDQTSIVGLSGTMAEFNTACSNGNFLFVGSTTADVNDSLNRRYVTDAELAVIVVTSGVNSGDQNSIVGITGTKAQFDIACSDGNFLYSGDVSATGAITIIFDGQGGVIAVGSQAYVTIPFNYTITGWEIKEVSPTPVSSSIVIDAWKDTYANYPPTVADAVFTTKPTLLTQTKNQNLAPTFVGGSTGLNDDTWKFNVDSCTGAVKVAVTIFLTKTA